MRSGLGNCWRMEGSGSRPWPWGFRNRKPRLIEPSGFVVPRSAGAGGEARSDSGEPMELLATSIACVPCAAGTTRFLRFMIDFFIVTGRWTPWSL